MKPVFADTSFWIALFDPTDLWHDAAVRARSAVAGRRMVTTDAVIAEFLNFVCSAPPHVRQLAVRAARGIWANPRIETVPATRESYLSAVDLYERRPDRTYSHTDCLSILAMRERKLLEVLSSDEHFTQEGFLMLLER